MIKLGLLHIEEFRGIRDLDIDFGYESFDIHGPNGSGKSGVVDAVGFVLTGTITRLTGAGTGAVSVKVHAPHVMSKDDPEAARVSLTFKEMKTGEVGTVTRTVKDATGYTLVPDTPALRAALEETRSHPELTLSRREIIKFILAEPTKRATEVQALLQLDKLETNRRALKSAHNKLKDSVKAAATAVVGAQQLMEVLLGITGLTAEKIKEDVNKHRKMLGLEEFTEVKLSTNLKSGLDETSQEKSFDKEAAQRAVAAYQTYIAGSAAKTAADELLTEMAKLPENTDLEALKGREFLETGLALVAEEAVCPLCDTQWKTPAALRAHLESKIETTKELARVDSAIRSKAATLQGELGQERNLLKAIQTLSVTWSSAGDQEILQKRYDLLVEADALLKDTPAVFGFKERLEAGALNHSADAVAAVGRLKEKLNKQPDTSEKAKSRSHLIVAAERWGKFRSRKGERSGCHARCLARATGIRGILQGGGRGTRKTVR